MVAKGPCATCGKLLFRGPQSLPIGVARCHPCRRTARGLAPDQLIRDHWPNRAPRAKPKGVCHRCEGPVPPGTRRWKFCSEACFVTARRAKGQGFAKAKESTTTRGYGIEHQRLRAQLLPLAYGSPCVLCGVVMAVGDDLHLDHNEDRTGYRGMVHAACNRRDGARRGNERQRQLRLERGWRPGQDPSTRRRTQGARRAS